MPLIVETGQGIPNADSYVSLEDGAHWPLSMVSNYRKMTPRRRPLRNGAVYVGLLSLRCADVVYLQTRR